MCVWNVHFKTMSMTSRGNLSQFMLALSEIASMCTRRMSILRLITGTMYFDCVLFGDRADMRLQTIHFPHRDYVPLVSFVGDLADVRSQNVHLRLITGTMCFDAFCSEIVPMCAQDYSFYS